MSSKKYMLKTDLAIFEIKREPLGLWDLWVNSMPTLTFESPEDAAKAVNEKKQDMLFGIIKKKKLTLISIQITGNLHLIASSIILHR